MSINPIIGQNVPSIGNLLELKQVHRKSPSLSGSALIVAVALSAIGL